MNIDITLPQADGGVPLLAHLLVADTCNHACVHCYQVHGRKGEMTLEQIEESLDELARMGVLFVAVSGGEATLRPDLIPILEAARRRGFAIILQTNGFSVSDELVDAMVRLGVWQVRISVYSTIAGEHDAVTLVPGSFEKTIDTVRRLVARAIRVSLSVPLTSHCSVSTSALEAFAASLGCEVEITAPITAKEDGSATSLAVVAGSAQLEQFYAAKGEAVPSVEEKLGQRPCGACTQILTIHSNGSVRPCTHIPFEFGDVAAEGARALAHVAENDAFQLVSGIRWRDIHGCRDCALLSWCSRCHGSASFENGDLFGPQPSACHLAKTRYEAVVSKLELAPAVDSDVAERAPGVGPFEIVDGTTLRPIRDVCSEDDEARARRFPWTRPSAERLRELSGIVPVKRLVRRQVTQATGSCTLPQQERNANEAR